jgi:hypothetical protein
MFFPKHPQKLQILHAFFFGGGGVFLGEWVIIVLMQSGQFFSYIMIRTKLYLDESVWGDMSIRGLLLL